VRTPATKIVTMLVLRFAHIVAGAAAVFAILSIVFGNHPS